jgi:hypothetical protein
VSGRTLGDDVVELAIGQILADAARQEAGGLLTSSFERELASKFDAIARDRNALERAVEAGALSQRQSYRFGGKPATSRSPADRGSREGEGALALVVRRSARLAKGVSRKGTATARRVVGPALRSLERRTVDQAGRAAEALATRGHVAADHARRVASSGGTSGRLGRVSPSGRALPAWAGDAGNELSSPAVGTQSADSGIAAIEDWIVDRVGRRPGGRVLHAECRDGALVRRLSGAGHDASGADPVTAGGNGDAGRIVRASALECLGAQRRSSLSGLVLSGVTEDVSPGSARALAHLASTRLERGGIVVLASPHPRRVASGDPITSDLASRRPLHPVTWCHLLARYGFVEITVFDPGDGGNVPATGTPAAAGSLYAVAARRA